MTITFAILEKCPSYHCPCLNPEFPARYHSTFLTNFKTSFKNELISYTEMFQLLRKLFFYLSCHMIVPIFAALSILVENKLKDNALIRFTYNDLHLFLHTGSNCGHWFRFWKECKCLDLHIWLCLNITHHITPVRGEQVCCVLKVTDFVFPCLDCDQVYEVVKDFGFTCKIGILYRVFFFSPVRLSPVRKCFYSVDPVFHQ